MVDLKTSQVSGLIDVSGTVDLSRLDLIRYAEATSVAASTLTTILTYTAAQNTNISLITVSGCDYAKYSIYIDTVQIGTLRSGPSRNVEWNFSFPLALDSGSVLDVKVIHYYTGDVADFEAGFYMFQSA